MAVLKRTPCVGICSTTYGDLVCRGCKRFAHEIVMWNGFTDQQRALVWDRLYSLLDSCVAGFVRVVDEQQLREAAGHLRVIDVDQLSLESLAFEVLRRSARRTATLSSLGLAAETDDSPGMILESIEQDFYLRSLARYERDFRTPAN